MTDGEKKLMVEQVERAIRDLVSVCERVETDPLQGQEVITFIGEHLKNQIEQACKE